MIKVNNVSKTYIIWKKPFSRLFVPLARLLVKPFSPNWYAKIEEKHIQAVQALSNINFELNQGDSLGILGLNGGGKSTLLQIIAGTLQATHGEVKVEGRIAALLELGSGFDPAFTGKENVYLNAAILGLSTTEIDECYDDIVSFADIGEFIALPVKTYSSGMVLRLAFAVQVHVSPDILIVDEALSVGDARFQAKALTKVEEILNRGTTLLFVGHDLNAVRAFCGAAMLMDKGTIQKIGLPEDVIFDYQILVQQCRLEDTGSNQKINRTDTGIAVDGFGINHATILGHGRHASISFNSTIDIQLELNLPQKLQAPFLIFELISERGLHLTGKRIAIPNEVMLHKLAIQLTCPFQKGIYRTRFRIVDAPTIEQTQLMSRQDDLLSLELTEDVRHLFIGIFPMAISCQWANNRDT